MSWNCPQRKGGGDGVYGSKRTDWNVRGRAGDCLGDVKLGQAVVTGRDRI